ncbi:MAG TPA: 50S ribosomal protein L2 [Candidatus Nanoarchaeia archaeon]|nr:50S ribosomal protein L2 [Candidatus Nanoarchaeia archaeon]
MGKNLIQQKRGKGSSRYRSPGFKFKGPAAFARYDHHNSSSAEIVDLVHCSGHSAPLMELKYSTGEVGLLQAPEGVKVGDRIEINENAELKSGNIMPLKNIPEGTSVYNIESNPGDGGKFVRTSGAFARIITKMDEGIVVELPSSKRRTFLPECRAIIGIISGSGRTEKPLLKAGTNFYKKTAKNQMWPKVSGTSMNAVSHPFGGRSSHAKGVPTQSARNSPPGRKVGKIAPKRTGRKKR